MHAYASCTRPGTFGMEFKASYISNHYVLGWQLLHKIYALEVPASRLHGLCENLEG